MKNTVVLRSQFLQKDICFKSLENCIIKKQGTHSTWDHPSCPVLYATRSRQATFATRLWLAWSSCNIPISECFGFVTLLVCIPFLRIHVEVCCAGFLSQPKLQRIPLGHQGGLHHRKLCLKKPKPLGGSSNWWPPQGGSSWDSEGALFNEINVPTESLQHVSLVYLQYNIYIYISLSLYIYVCIVPMHTQIYQCFEISIFRIIDYNFSDNSKDRYLKTWYICVCGYNANITYIVYTSKYTHL